MAPLVYTSVLFHGMHPFSHSANNFERGQKDIFALQAPDIGDLTHVIVRKDNSGVASDWHLQVCLKKKQKHIEGVTGTYRCA